MALGLTPKVLDSVDMTFVLYKLFCMVNTAMSELTDMKRVVTFKWVGVDDAIRLYFLSYNRGWCICSGVRDDTGIYTVIAFKQSKQGHFVNITLTKFTFVPAAKIASINFYLKF